MYIQGEEMDKLSKNTLQFIEDMKNINKNFEKSKGRKKTATIITHGCQMNEHDSEKINAILQDMDYIIVNDMENSDLVLLNTCSVRHSAEDKVYGQLGHLKAIKRSKPDMIIGVCGCMMQRKESRDYVLEKFENVDLIFGTNNIYRLPELLLHNIEYSELALNIEDNPGRDEFVRANRLYKHKAFVNIMYGCNNFCTYCIVPYTRGRETSRRPEDIVEEIEQLVKNGVKEVMLLGQNVNSYGKNLEEKISFADLLRRINAIEGLERIRFMTSHPKDISDELLECYRDCDKLCKFLHLPVQAGSNKVLKEMNRHYSREDYLKKIEKAREICPDISLSTDIMVGFPGESEEDFEDTLDLVKRVGYDMSFTFLYSIREGTPAANRLEQIDQEEKQKRFERLLDTLYPIALEKNKKLIGSTQKVLVENISKNNESRVSGRTDGFKLVNFEGDKSLIGQIVDVEITSANTFSLEGRVK
ncbi:tRNA-i(6)A37 thiotransferase enzyme MiaB [Clostridiales bacterium KA00134]|nr:tRNA-i(6)A37 thiotransferase enzyme MiaB [Clostridiales bacterium KA00134]